MNTISLPSPLKQVTSHNQLSRVWDYRKNEYNKTYKEISGFKNDPFDDKASIIYAEDSNKKITSTGRLTFDGKRGLPEDSVFPKAVNEYREQGLKIVELGRFIISNSNLTLLKAYYEAFYKISVSNNVHAIVMVMRQKDVAFHKHMIGAKTLADNVGISFGSNHDFACVTWEIKETKPKFFKWIGKKQLLLETAQANKEYENESSI